MPTERQLAMWSSMELSLVEFVEWCGLYLHPWQREALRELEKQMGTSKDISAEGNAPRTTEEDRRLMEEAHQAVVRLKELRRKLREASESALKGGILLLHGNDCKVLADHLDALDGVDPG